VSERACGRRASSERKDSSSPANYNRPSRGAQCPKAWPSEKAGPKSISQRNCASPPRDIPVAAPHMRGTRGCGIAFVVWVGRVWAWLRVGGYVCR
jgi:hypothetical protein